MEHRRIEFEGTPEVLVQPPTQDPIQTYRCQYSQEMGPITHSGSWFSHTTKSLSPYEKPTRSGSSLYLKGEYSRGQELWQKRQVSWFPPADIS